MVLLPIMENQSHFCKPQDPAELDNAEQQRHQAGTFRPSRIGRSAVLYSHVGETLALLSSSLEKEKAVLSHLPTCECKP